MMNRQCLLNCLLVATMLSFAPSKASADLKLPQAVQGDVERLFPNGSFRQGMQLGLMYGQFITSCFMVQEGVSVPGEGVMTVDTLNEISAKLIGKVRAEFDDYLFEYQKLGMNMGIAQCNQILDKKIKYIP